MLGSIHFSLNPNIWSTKRCKLIFSFQVSVGCLSIGRFENLLETCDIAPGAPHFTQDLK